MYPAPNAAASHMHSSPSSVTTSSHDSTLDLQDPFFPGALVGAGIQLNGEPVVGNSATSSDQQQPVFEVVRKLGTGSYAVVYLVRQLLHAPVVADDMEHFVLDDHRPPSPAQPKYGREYAIKCLSKANLDADSLTAQRLEATIHQSLPIHPNIVSLHSTLESDSFLLLILEYVPGEDLFYFLEQSKDHQPNADSAFPLSATHSTNKRYSTSSQSSESSFTYQSQATPAPQPIAIPVPADPPISPLLANTPPTPTLLAASHPSQLLSHRRLRLIASMFSQMCDALATCHQLGVFHRDIKPENFIVTDGFVYVDGKRERKVVVKLTDFGLATNDEESADMDCGSAPYMSYECRNNCAPTYAPRHADVWSLGIVLINMLYHHNPWSDTAEGACKSFSSFRAGPIPFFMQRFNGMTLEVAEFLANKVFCIFDDMPSQPKQRVSAADFGQWVKDLPTLMGSPPYRPLSQEAKPRLTNVFSPILISAPPARRDMRIVAASPPRVGFSGPVPPPATRGSLVSGISSALAANRLRSNIPPPLATTISLPSQPQHLARRSSPPPTPDLVTASGSSDGMLSPPGPELLSLSREESTASAAEEISRPHHCRAATDHETEGTTCVECGRSTSMQKRNRKRGRKGKAAKEASALTLALSESLGGIDGKSAENAVIRPVLDSRHTYDSSNTPRSALINYNYDQTPMTANSGFAPIDGWSPSLSGRNFSMSRTSSLGGGFFSSSSDTGDHLEDVAKAAQALAREISRTPKSPKTPLSSVLTAADAPPLPPLPAVVPVEASPVPMAPAPTKKKSPWSMFRRADSSASSGETLRAAPTAAGSPSPGATSPTESVTPSQSLSKASGGGAKIASPKVQNVSNAIMGLSASKSTVSLASVKEEMAPSSSSSTTSGAMSWRGKRKESNVPKTPESPTSPDRWEKKSNTGASHPKIVYASSLSNAAFAPPAFAFNPPAPKAGTNAVYSAPYTRAASSSRDWRQSTASFNSVAPSVASTNSSYAASNFTRFSNGSVRSVSTTATSVTSGSWRQPKTEGRDAPPSPTAPTQSASTSTSSKPKRPLPGNVKRMDGIPRELGEAPRQFYAYSSSSSSSYGGKSAAKNPKRSTASSSNLALDSIPEREKSRKAEYGNPYERSGGAAALSSGAIVEESGSGPSSPVESPGGENFGGDAAPKKVKQGQIHALGKMLSALKSR